MGARNINEKFQTLARRLGGGVVKRGHVISSGNAEGADENFAAGANKIAPERVVLYIPDSKHRPASIHPQNKVCQIIKPEWMEIAKQYHPKWHLLKTGVQQLMARNVGIVNKADAVIAMPDFTKLGLGGTGHSIRVAEGHFKIPVWLIHPDNEVSSGALDNFLNKIVPKSKI